MLNEQIMNTFLLNYQTFLPKENCVIDINKRQF